MTVQTDTLDAVTLETSSSTLSASTAAAVWVVCELSIKSSSAADERGLGSSWTAVLLGS